MFSHMEHEITSLKEITYENTCSRLIILNITVRARKTINTCSCETLLIGQVINCEDLLREAKIKSSGK